MIFVLLGVAAGVLIGLSLQASPDRYLRSVHGPVPHYAVHREAELVAARLAASVTADATRTAIGNAARQIRAWTSVDGFNPGRPASRYGRVAAAFTADGGRRVYVQGGDGWEHRLAIAMAHAIRGLVHGDEDPEQRDRRWFDAAHASWLDRTQKGSP